MNARRPRFAARNYQKRWRSGMRPAGRAAMALRRGLRHNAKNRGAASVGGGLKSLSRSAPQSDHGPPPPGLQPPGRGPPGEVFRVFLKLGLTSFGGPIAHLGYFRDELVVRRRWIDEAGYADLIALCQFLPGPASSQVGFSLGVLRGGGVLGGLAAWAGFTAPSALVLLAFALGASAFAGPVAQGLQHGLKLVAVAVVAQALWGMARSLTPDRARAAIALGALAIVVAIAGSLAQIAAIGAGALAGLALCRGGVRPMEGALRFPVGRGAALAALGLFVALFLAPPLLGGAAPAIALFNAFYRSGAFVFGGGHVVLPLLQTQVVAPGWVADQTFLTGYGLVQAVPGPLFSFAVYLGAVMTRPPNGVAGAAIALVGLFLPGLLLVYGISPFWDRLRRRALAQAAMRGANAAVVGILGAAFYKPVWTSAVLTQVDFALAAAGFLLLTVWKAPPWIVVALLAAFGAATGLMSQIS
jgi:chromate transporter